LKELIRVVSLAVAVLPLQAASAQQEAQLSVLTLRQAVNIALEKNPLRKANASLDRWQLYPVVTGLATM
jgi:hypothetical protein